MSDGFQTFWLTKSRQKEANKCNTRTAAAADEEGEEVTSNENVQPVIRGEDEIRWGMQQVFLFARKLSRWRAGAGRE